MGVGIRGKTDATTVLTENYMEMKAAWRLCTTDLFSLSDFTSLLI